jgi:3-methyladenine DNA glycosylase AlkD
MIADPDVVTEEQAERWVRDFDSWDVCDQCCNNLLKNVSFSYEKASEWSLREEEFVKRAGFVLMACLAVSDKRAEDTKFQTFLPMIKREAVDTRNYVKKAVNWALRQIGKRNSRLNRKAIEASQEILQMDFPSARWIASYAIRELTSQSVQLKLKG